MFSRIWTNLPSNLANVSYGILQKVVQLPCPCHTGWSSILQKLGNISDDAETAEEICQRLYCWSCSDGSFQELLKVLCEVGHATAAQELLSHCKSSMAISTKLKM